MISSLDAAAERFLAALDLIHQRGSLAENRITSGKRVMNPSDDPASVPLILADRAHLDQTTQIKTNLTRFQAEVDTAESTIQQAVKIVEKIIQVGVHSASGTTGTAGRMNDSVEARGLQDRLVALTAARVEGRYIFSGDNDQVAPYALDITQVSGTTAYAGSSSATRQAMHPNGTRFSVAKTAQQIFDAPGPGNSVFAAVQAIATAMETDNIAGVQTALASLGTANTTLSNMLNYYGTVQNRVSEAVQAGSKLELTLKTAVSNLQDTDMPTAIMELTQAKTSQDAALAVRSKMPKSSLFDYIA